MFKFERLDVWKISLELYRKIVTATGQLRRRDQVALGDQIRRAALSISANIAEGTGREGVRESKQFSTSPKGPPTRLSASRSLCAKRVWWRKNRSPQSMISAIALRECYQP
jgi:hypothetical protein